MEESQGVLEATEDALLLGYHLDEAAAEFELVCECWKKCERADRSFVLFLFRGVRQFRRIEGAYARLQAARSIFVSRSVVGAWEVQSVQVAKVQAGQFVSVDMGLSFGGLEFGYDVVSHRTVHLYAAEYSDNDWVYFEVGTDRLVDFYNPFDSAWARPVGP